MIFATTCALDKERAADQRKVLAARRHVVLLCFCREYGAAAGAQVAGGWAVLTPGSIRQRNPVQKLEIDVKETLGLNRLRLPFPPSQRAGGARRRPLEDGSPSALWHARGESATWWAFALPPNQPASWRALGRRAGCCVINDHDETTLLGDGFLIVTVPGSERLRLPDGGGRHAAPRATVFDADTGAICLVMGKETV